MPPPDITAAQCRAARALLRWSQQTLADRSRVSIVTIQNFESEKTASYAGTLLLLRQAFEAAGVEFIPADNGGVGVRLKKSTSQ
jgi:transcriptional regulator with XRE-family HTH domain